MATKNTLEVQIGLNNKKFLDAIKQTKREAKELEKSFKNIDDTNDLKNLEQQFRSFGTELDKLENKFNKTFSNSKSIRSFVKELQTSAKEVANTSFNVSSNAKQQQAQSNGESNMSGMASIATAGAMSGTAGALSSSIVSMNGLVDKTKEWAMSLAGTAKDWLVLQAELLGYRREYDGLLLEIKEEEEWVQNTAKEYAENALEIDKIERKINEIINSMGAFDDIKFYQAGEDLSNLEQLENELQELYKKQEELTKDSKLHNNKLNEKKQKVQQILSEIRKEETHSKSIVKKAKEQNEALNQSVKKTKDLANNTKKVSKETDGMAKSAKSAGNSFGNILGSVFSIAMAMRAIRAIKDFGKACIESASNLEEVQNVVDVSFGSMRDMCEEFAQSAIEGFGLSEYSAKKMSSTFMAMANSTIGFSQNSAKMSINLAKLSADMASFYNISTDVAETALSSVFTGETESLKRLGVVMTEANLQQYAYANGINKSVQNMTDAEKVMLRYNYVMEKTGQAHGDFARTSGSWANQIRLLSQQFNQLRVVIGQDLIQAFLPVIQILNIFIKKLLQAYQVIRKVFGFKDVQISAPMADAVAPIKSNASAVGDVGKGLDNATKSAKKYQKTIASFDELNLLADNSQDNSPSGAGAGGIGDTGIGDIGDLAGWGDIADYDLLDYEGQKNKFEDMIDSFIKNITEKLEPVLTPLKNIFKALWEDTKQLVDTFAEIGSGMDVDTSISNFGKMLTVIEKIVSATKSTNAFILNTLKTIAENPSIKYLQRVLQEIYDFICENLIEAFSDLGDFWDKHGKGITSIINLIITTLYPLIILIDLMVQRVSDFMKVLQALWDVLQPVVGIIVDFFGACAQFVNDVLIAIFDDTKTIEDAWDDFCEEIKRLGRQFAKDFLDGAQKALEKLQNTYVFKHAMEIYNIVKDLFEKIQRKYEEFKRVAENITGLIKTGLKNKWEDIKNNAVNTFIDMKEKVGEKFEDLKYKAENSAGLMKIGLKNKWEDTKNTILNTAIDIKEKALEKFEDFKEGIVDVFTTLKNALKTPLNGIIGLVNGLCQRTVNGVNQIISTINGVKFSVPTNKATQFMGIAGIGWNGFNIPRVAYSGIPLLANGGVISAPTVAMMGEYTNARSNPEIVAPQSLLQEVIASGNNELIDVWLQTTRQIISTIENKDLDVNIGDDVIANSIIRSNNASMRRTGKPIFNY